MVLAPAATVMDGFAGILAVNEMVTVDAVTPLPLARTVTVAVPATAVGPSVSVNTLVVAPAANVAGVNAAVTPVGSPSAVNTTAPVNPPLRKTVMGTEAGVLGEATVASVPTATMIVGVVPVGGRSLVPEQAATDANARMADMRPKARSLFAASVRKPARAQLFITVISFLAAALTDSLRM